MKQMKKATLAIALPIAIQNLVAFIANMMDTVMVGQISESAFASISLANQVFFVITLVISGIAGGSNVILSQMWGRQDKEGMFKILAYTYRVVLIFVVLVSMCAVLMPEIVMSLFTHDMLMIETGSSYLKIVGISYLFFAISSTSVQVLRSANIVKISMVSSLTALVLNIILNYILIFGHFGFPVLGVKGAAIATTIARFVELCVVIIYLYVFEDQLQIRIKKLIPLDKSYRKLFFRNCTPVALNEFLWSSGESVVVMIIGRMGTSAVAAIGIYNVVAQLSNVLMNGFDSAACIIIGNTLGKKDIDELMIQKRFFQRLSLFIGVIDGLIMILAIPVALLIYDISLATETVLIKIMLVGSIIEVFKSLQCMNMMGILRGGGDVRFAAMNDIVFVWLFCVPVGYISAFVFKLPFSLVFFLIKSDQIWKYFTSEYRIRKNKWMNYIEEGERKLSEL